MAKLKIYRCAMKANKIEPKSDDDSIFEATINPESYTHNFSLQYSGTEGKGDAPVGTSGAVPKYARADPEKVSFSIVVDGTGVVEATEGQTVAGQIEQLRKIVYDYDGQEHEPTAVKIVWGKGLKAFFGRLTSMGVDYTIFHPDGTALRAKIKMDFIEARTAAQEALEANRKSPDLTHVVTVQAGDTLPLLCHKIYDDPSKYLQVAQFNNLDNFRELEPNTQLRFPPMRA